MIRLTIPQSIAPPIGTGTWLTMALTAQPDSQDTCGIGSGPFAAHGFAEVRQGSDFMEIKCLRQITSTLTLFCHPIPHNRSSLLSPPPNYHHELTVASDGWRSAREFPVAHHRPIIVVVEASSSS
jgi:hypothetical protein